MKKRNSLTKASRMVALRTAAIVVIAAATILTGCKKETAPQSEALELQHLSNEVQYYQSGTNNGFFWSLWKSDGATGTVNYSNGSDGNYSVSWNGFNGNFTCGKGYSVGSSSYKIGYNLGVYSNSGGGTFGWYGWSRNPYYEYYVNETWGAVSPHTGTYLGTFESDGAGYNVWTRWVTGKNIDGGDGFRQIYSSRVNKVTTGQNRVITFANHYNKWSSFGYTLGQLNIPAIMVSETWGTNTNGNINCTIWAQ
ncbi:glycoside hydrolase family 11 protein [Filimonas effusa]|uniref:endo-1,4-beta-xylanase n=1 Tax=Filimonas effusa TaxID=2508721 RepID=A0A4Q1D5V5_9BACT|nr:glycoside hydrolase family 11 protein [Filimonas effusa]RXK83356.1 1,4-beta-xylanase [Filimonas effusa]